MRQTISVHQILGTSSKDLEGLSPGWFQSGFASSELHFSIFIFTWERRIFITCLSHCQEFFCYTQPCLNTNDTYTQKIFRNSTRDQLMWSGSQASQQKQEKFKERKVLWTYSDLTTVDSRMCWWRHICFACFWLFFKRTNTLNLLPGEIVK